MPTLSTFILFSLAATALIVVPGPAVLYVVARSIEQGRLAGFVSVLGISVGAIVHTVAAALGIAAILVTSAFAFAFVKYLGAAYLIYLGVKTLMQPAKNPDTSDVENDKANLKTIFYEGIIVNTLNPKGALFFFAFLPQFVDPARGNATVQIILFGVIFIVIALVSDSLYALAAGTLGNWLKQSENFWKRQRIFSGTTYIVLGIATAFTGSKK